MWCCHNITPLVMSCCHLIGIWGDGDPAAPFFFAALVALLLPAAVCAALLLGLGRQKDALDMRAMLRSAGSTEILVLLAVLGNAELLRLLPWSHARLRNTVGIELGRSGLMWLVTASYCWLLVERDSSVALRRRSTS